MGLRKQRSKSRVVRVRREVSLNTGRKDKKGEIGNVGWIAQIASAPTVEPLQGALTEPAVRRPRRSIFDSRNESVQTPAEGPSDLENSFAIDGQEDGFRGHLRPEEMSR